MICVEMFACVDVVLRVLLYLSSHGGAVREEGGGGGMVGLQLSAATVGWQDEAEMRPSREPGRGPRRLAQSRGWLSVPMLSL